MKDEHTILVRKGGARGFRMGYGDWLAFKDEHALTRDAATPQRIITHRGMSAETVITAWYTPDGTLRVVTRETCAI